MSSEYFSGLNILAQRTYFQKLQLDESAFPNPITTLGRVHRWMVYQNGQIYNSEVLYMHLKNSTRYQ